MAHLYARFLVSAVDLGNNSIGTGGVSIAEVVFYDNANSVISTSGGIASASSTNGGPTGFVPANAFDGNSTNFWNSDGMTAGTPEWLQMQFAAPVDIDHFSLTFAGGTGYDAPSNFSFQVSDDGATWTTVYSYQGAMRMTGSYTNTLYTSGIVYRLNVTAVQSGTRAIFSNVKLYDSGAAVITGVLGSGFASSYDGGLTFDGANPTQGYNQTCSNWFSSSGTPSSGSPEWVSFQFPSGTPTPASLSFQTANFTGAIANTPVVFSLQSSTDGTNFTTLQTFASAAWTTTCQTQTFNLVAPTRSITASPAIGTQCQTETVTITGLNTHFVNGTTTVAISGPGATVSSVSVSSATSLTFSLALSCTAQLGVRTITVATGAESDTAPFVVEAGPTIASLLQGNIAWAQLRLGFNGRFGTGMYGASTDGTGSAGVIPVWGGPDGETLTAGGAGAISSGFLTTYVAGTPILDSSGNPIVDANGNWIFPG